MSSSDGSPEAAALDDALYPPRMDRLPLPEAVEGQGLGAGPEYGDLLESICGATDDSQAVEQYDGTLGVTAGFVNAHQQPVAQVQWKADLAARYTNSGDVNGVRWGSGTMIGPDLFLTCGHLFDQAPNGWTVPRQNGTANAISPQQIALEMHLNFLYQEDSGGSPRAEQSFPIVSLLEYRLGGVDMALCRIGGNPGNTYGWTEVSSVDAAVGDMIAIIGHPAGQPKRIEAGPVTALGGGVVRYNDIDTLGGNSGSGILQASTGRVIGVHTNGGCNRAGTGSNLGQSIAAVRAVSPTLQALAPGSRTASADDGLGTPLAADIGVTLHAADVIGTRVAADQLDTRLSRDIGIGTLRAADTGLQDTLGTSLARDVGGGGTRLALDFGTFRGGDDPDLTIAEGIVNPGRPPIDFGRFGPGARLRPFVQAGPYAPQPEQADVEPEVLDAVLEELEEAIEAQTAALASLQALHATLSAL